MLVNRAGHVIYRISGYLTVNPLLPGASAEFRAYGPEAPAFVALHTAFLEAGQPVIVETVKSLPLSVRAYRGDHFLRTQANAGDVTNARISGLTHPFNQR